MSNQFKNILLGAAASSALFGCNLGVDREGNETPEGYYYEGYIYNGVTNERVTDLAVSASQRGETVTGTVDEDGHFSLGPVKPDHDYVVTIEAEGYREFFAAETGPSNLPNSDDNQTTRYYEAFLFPENIASPEVTLDFYTPDGIDARPTGTLRLTPAGGSTLSQLHLDAATTLGSVGGQIWTNDADRRQRTATFEVEDGQVVVAEGDLVYGVAYVGTIFGSDGYAYENFLYTSGLEGDRTVSLDRLDPQNLTLTANSLDISNQSNTGEIVLTFNQPVELAEVIPEAQLAEILDDAFEIESPDADNDGDMNILESNIGDDPDTQERGVSLSVSGNTLTLSWARDDSNFVTTDNGDPIESVTYGGLGNIDLRIAGGRTDQEVNLASLLGNTELTVYVDGVSATNPLPPLALNSTVATGDQNTGPVTVVYTFNRAIEFDPDTYTPVQMAENIDNSFSINSPNAQVNPNPGWDQINTLPFNSLSTVQERGTSVAISGSTLTLTWDRSLNNADPLDPILEATFSNLFYVQLRPVGTFGTEDVTLSTVAGSSEVVTLTP